jgi:hypothetical protein
MRVRIPKTLVEHCSNKCELTITDVEISTTKLGDNVDDMLAEILVEELELV